jgi:hypothetical protein
MGGVRTGWARAGRLLALPVGRSDAQWDCVCRVLAFTVGRGDGPG